MVKVSSTLKTIQELRKQFYLLAPGQEALVQKIADAELAEYVFDSNAIENNSLSLAEVEAVLQEKPITRNVDEREIVETQNLSRLIEYVGFKALEKELDLEFICLLHKMLFFNMQTTRIGLFNDEEALKNVAQLLINYKFNPQEHIVQKVARFHLEFEHIHPFVDGNGRIGRVFNNFLLIREGYVPINIKFVDRQVYYEAFKEYDESKKTTIMEEIIGRAIANSYHKRLAYLAGKKIITLNEYAKQNHIAHSNLINKANRQTIPVFSEKGIWKIGI